MAKGKTAGKRAGASRKKKTHTVRVRRGKSEAMTGKKAGEVEVRTPMLDLVEIDDGDFDMHLRSMKGAKERMKQAKNLYDGCCKAAKKVSPDLLASVKRALTFEGMDPDDIKRALEIDGYVLRRTANPVQLSVFDALAGDVQKQAYMRGLGDAKAGKGAENKYPEGSDLAKQYSKGFRHGTADTLGVDREDADREIDGDDELPIPQPEGAGEREAASTH